MNITKNLFLLNDEMKFKENENTCKRQSVG